MEKDSKLCFRHGNSAWMCQKTQNRQLTDFVLLGNLDDMSILDQKKDDMSSADIMIMKFQKGP